MRKSVMVLSVVLALVMGLGGLSAQAAAPAGKIKFGHVAPPGHGQTVAIDAFAAYVKEKTGGKIDIATFPASQLGSERSMAEQVQAGTLQIASITTALLQNFVPQVAVVDFPFVFPSPQTAYAVLDDKEFQAKIFSYLEPKGFVGIGWTENGFRDFSNTKKPVRKPEDLKGMKVRVMESPVYLAAFEQLGASAVGMPFAEVYQGLQQGVIDAQENPIYTAILMKFTEVTKYATITNHILTECAIIVNPDYWKTLKPEEQKIFRDAADMTIKINRETNAKLTGNLPGIGKSVEAYAKDKGVELISLTADEREAFRKAMVPVWEKFKPRVGNDFYDFFMKKIAQHKK